MPQNVKYTDVTPFTYVDVFAVYLRTCAQDTTVYPKIFGLSRLTKYMLTFGITR
jgi:hypothetical protein